MPEGGSNGGYRDELAAAYERVRQLEARNRDLEAALRSQPEDPAVEHVRDLDATLQRWDRVRSSLAMLLGLTGLFALRIAEHWSVRLALLATCAAMVTVGIILAWPKMVRAQVDPKPHALDVTPWRRRRRNARRAQRNESETRVRVEPGESSEPVATVDGDEGPTDVAPAAKNGAVDAGRNS